MREKLGLNESAVPMDLAGLDFECAPAIKQATIERVILEDYGYVCMYGAYYDALIGWSKRRFHVSIEKEWIKLTFGTCGTLYYIVQCSCNEGDAVVINTPAYDPFVEAAEYDGCRSVCNPLELENMCYYLGSEEVEHRMVEGNVELFALCSPQNPSERVWTKKELHQLSTLYLEHDVLLVCNEIHCDVIFDWESFTILWNAHEGITGASIMCVSPNKDFNLGDLKPSYITVKNRQARGRLLVYLQKVCVTSLHIYVVPAIIAACSDSEEWLDRLTAYIGESFIMVCDWFVQHMLQIRVMKGDFSLLVWIDMRSVFANEDKMRAFFIRTDVSTVVGNYFVQDDYGRVRPNIRTQKSIPQRALRRVAVTWKV